MFQQLGVISNVILNKECRSPLNNLAFHLRKLGKEEQSKCKASRRKEIVKLRMETIVAVCYL